MSEPPGHGAPIVASTEHLKADMASALERQDAARYRAEVAALLARLDGTDLAALSVATGFTLAEIAELGGLDLSTIPTNDPQPNPAIPSHAERAEEL